MTFQFKLFVNNPTLFGAPGNRTPLSILYFSNNDYDSNHLPRDLPSNPLTSPNNLEQSLSVIEFDKKSDSISHVFVKLFKTQNELLSEQDINTFSVIKKLLLAS